MTRTTIGILAGIAVAAGVALRLEASLAAGLMGGVLMGSAMGLLGGSLLAHTARTQPARAFQALVQAFLLKLLGLLVGVLSLRFVPAAAALADWRSFAIGYATAAFLSLVLCALDAMRSLKGESAL